MLNGQILSWIGLYSAANHGVDCADTTLRLDPDNEPPPDAMLWIDAAAGGHARISEDDYLEGSPELITVLTRCNLPLPVYSRTDGTHSYCFKVFQDLDP